VPVFSEGALTMPPKKIYWPRTLEEFHRLKDESKAKYLPLVMNLQFYELVGLSEATADALAAMRVEASKEAAHQGVQLPGRTIGR
jgi:hypothetical protein